jgi:hypothetical protein
VQLYRVTRSILLPALGLALIHAARATTPACVASNTTLNCRLQDFLQFLYGAAGFLALTLVIIIILAVRFYRKNKNNPKAGE